MKNLNHIVDLAKRLTHKDKQYDCYVDAKIKVPDNFLKEQEELEDELDLEVKKYFKKCDNFKEELIKEELKTDVLRQIEFSYMKAIAFKKNHEGKSSRMFMLPAVYWMDQKGKPHGLMSFNQKEDRETLKQVILNFIDKNHHFEGVDMNEFEVKLYPHTITEWLLDDEEEKSLIDLHEAVIKEEKMDMDFHFPRMMNYRVNSAGEEGWSLGVLPFSIMHKNEKFLEQIDFEPFKEEFKEEFDSVFDPLQQLNYSHPAEPFLIEDEKVRLMWLHQVKIIVSDMEKQKKDTQWGLIAVNFKWCEAQIVGIDVDFKIQNTSDLNEQSGFHRRVSRAALLGESVQSFLDELLNFQSMKRGDFKTLFGHQYIEIDELGFKDEGE